MAKALKTIARKQRREKRRSERARQDIRRDLAQIIDYEAPASRRSAPGPIKPLNESQKVYDALMVQERIIFAVGPAGTGKTWLAAARAADALREGRISKIILTRPAVEAGEKLGFLPGDLTEKYEPYLRPFMEAFEERLGKSQTEYAIRKGTIEPRPLAFMRGATMKDCWLLADEAQNISRLQMKMLLSRIGENSRFVISGDIKQTDLRAGQSGLEDAIDRLTGVQGVGVARFGIDDIVRDGLCQRVIQAYEQ